MLRLSRRVGETIHVHVNYGRSLALRNMISKLGIDPSLLGRITDTIKFKLDSIEDVIVKIDAASHIDIVRSEIDRNPVDIA
jgi:sRNA-binding carbon storage regulator CsrA